MLPFSYFKNKKRIFESALVDAIDQMGNSSDLKEACRYALLTEGKRLRPILVMCIAEALGKNLPIFPAALSVEYFHTASLIADDLPCMDDDDQRRGKPSLHVAFGESIALLASYTLVAEGYGAISKCAKLLKNHEAFFSSADSRAVLALEIVTQNAGLNGATYGQFLDLFPQERTLENIQTLMEKKTATLFEIAFVFGWLFGGGDISLLTEIKACANHLGMAFQIVDDFEDSEEDVLLGRGLNIVEFLGEKKAMELYSFHEKAYVDLLKRLHLWTQPMSEIVWGLNRRLELLRV